MLAAKFEEVRELLVMLLKEFQRSESLRMLGALCSCGKLTCSLLVFCSSSCRVNCIGCISNMRLSDDQRRLLHLLERKQIGTGFYCLND